MRTFVKILATIILSPILLLLGIFIGTISIFNDFWVGFDRGFGGSDK